MTDAEQSKACQTTRLKISPDSPAYWEQYSFQPIKLTGCIAQILRGELDPSLITEQNIGEIDQLLTAVIQQLRAQEVECKTSISLTPEASLLLQVTPTIGDSDSVNNVWAKPPKGNKVMEIHNHPACKEKDNQNLRSYAFFSAPDLSYFAFKADTIAEAVIFEEGAAILIKTAKSKKRIERALQATDDARYGWVDLSNNLNHQFSREVSPKSMKSRGAFTINFAKKYAMRLLYIPQGSKQIKILV